MRFWLFALPKLLISRFSFVKQPPSVEITQGVFLSHRNIPPKNFSENFFKSTPSDFLLIFWREKLWRGAASFYLPEGGGTPFAGLLVRLWFAPLFPPLFPHSIRLCRRLRLSLSLRSRLASVLVGGWCWASLLPFLSCIRLDSAGMGASGALRTAQKWLK